MIKNSQVRPTAIALPKRSKESGVGFYHCEGNGMRTSPIKYNLAHTSLIIMSGVLPHREPSIGGSRYMAP